MSPTIWFLTWIISSAYSSIQDDSDGKFLEQYVSQHQFQSLRYSIIVCNRETGLDLLQRISSTNHGMATIHTTKEKLEAWVNLEEPQMFIANLDCDGMRKILREANEIGLFRKPFMWLFLDLTSTLGKTHGWYWEVLESFNILPDSDVKISKRINNQKIDIIGIYKVARNGTIIKENLAGWSEEFGLMIRNKKCPAARRSDLRSVTLTSSVMMQFSQNLKNLEGDLEKTHEDPASKVGYMMMKYLEEQLNVKIDFKVVRSIGEYENGRWTGMVGDIESGDSDLGATPATINPQLFCKVEYYAKVTPSGYKFIFQSPPLSYSNNIFTLPFDRTVWYCCFGMIAAASIVLYLAVMVENRNRQKSAFPDIVEKLVRRKKAVTDMDTDNHVMSQKVHNALENSLSDIVMLNVGAICLQGTVVEPKGPSGRIIAIFLYFSYMFLYVSYSACIVALLQSSDTSIKTLKHLLESPLAVGADDVDYSQHYFKTDTDPVRKAIYEKKVAPQGEPPHFLPVSEGIKKVRNGLYAYHVNTNEGYLQIQKTFSEDEKCGLQELEVSFFRNMDSYLMISKHSPYSEIIKIGIKKILERGLQSQVQRRIYTNKPVCGSKGSSFVNVGLVDCYPAFMVLLYGLALSLFIIVTEKFYKHRNMKRFANFKHE